MLSIVVVNIVVNQGTIKKLTFKLGPSQLSAEDQNAGAKAIAMANN